MSEQEKKGLVPECRFPEFERDGYWQKMEIGNHLNESRILGTTGDIAKKLTVKLWGNGVFKKQETVKGSASTQYYRRKAGQFIYSKLDFLNQAFGIIPKHLDGFESTVDLPCFDVDNEVDARFLLEYVQRKDFYKKYGELADGGRKAKRIQVETFLDFPVYLPKLKEQQKIADCFTSIDELITAQTQKLDTLKTHKKGLMQQLFPAEGETVPKCRFPEFRDAGDWKKKQLKHACDMQAGKFVQASEIQDCSNNDLFPCYGGNGLRGYTKTYTHEGTYSLIGRQGALCGNVNLASGRFHATEHAVVTTPNAGVDTNWLFYKLVLLNLNQYATGQAQPGLSVENLQRVEIKMPRELKEQQKIADCLTSIDDLITAQTQKLETLKTHKKGLMQQLFPAIDDDCMDDKAGVSA